MVSAKCWQINHKKLRQQKCQRAKLVPHNDNNKCTVLYHRQHDFIIDKITYEPL